MTVDHDAPLATFVDELTMEYVREYPHAVESVWEAVTTPEHLDVWMVPECRVDLRLGGTCSFSWGGPPEGAVHGTVTELDPPRLVRYSIEGGYLRFALEPIDGGTRLVFTHAFGPGEHVEADTSFPGSDQPAGPGTPWRPGFVAGFHGMLDLLDALLGGAYTAADKQAELDIWARGDVPPDHLQRIEVYRDHIRRTYPRG
jgi:uncharacterized protein YndB with AHSA1/START domain